MPPRDIEDIYPLSAMQKGMLYHTLFAPETVSTYVLQMNLVLTGSLDTAALSKSWKELVRNHAVLRTSFHWKEVEDPLQVVHREVEVEPVILDWQTMDADERRWRREALYEEERARAFDLERAPLFRLALVREAEDLHDLLWTFHHILLDGWSVALLLNEFLANYEASSAGFPFVPGNSKPFGEYVDWLQRQDSAAAEQYWRGLLDGFTEPTPLGLDGGRRGDSPAVERYRQLEFGLGRALTLRVEELARRTRVTLNTVMQGVWAVALSRYSGRRDVVYGSTVSGRSGGLAGVESIVGVLINTIPVRVDVRPELPLSTFLQRLQVQHVDSRQYESSSLIDIQRWSAVSRPLPLFESLFLFENFPLAAARSRRRGLDIDVVHSFERTNYPLTLTVGTGDELVVRIHGDEERFSEGAIGRLAGHLKALLHAFVSAPDGQIGDLSITTDEERRVVQDRNDTADAYPSDCCVHELIGAVAVRKPAASALEVAGVDILYGDLERRANRFARFLIANGAGPEDRVCVCLDLGLDLVVSLLGAWKAGAAYVPLDPTSPDERLAFMVRDCGSALVVTSAEYADRLRMGRVRTLVLEKERQAIAEHRDEPPQAGIHPENLAYVMYTSGSTGRPKGVMIPHRGLVNYLTWAARTFGLSGGRSLLHSSPSVDMTVTCLFAPLISGGQVVVADEKPGFAPLVEGLRSREGFELVKLTPTHLDLLEGELDPGAMAGRTRALVVGGEALHHEQLEPWLQNAPDTRLINEYGPTETVVGCSWHEVVQEAADASGPVSIGRPIANARLYVLDSRQEPVPVGAVGELYVAGDCVARGYHGRPALTAELFLADPFAPLAGARMYRTGDLARSREDGTIQYVGRIDDQVKVRGFRVELGEIEAALKEHAAICEAAVALRREDARDVRLVAYLVAQEEARPSVVELREYLRGRLPEHMVPSAFAFLEELPHTQGGKVDRRALPESPDCECEPLEPFVPPRTALESTIASIWSEVLGREVVGAADSFFDLGGHSLLLLRVQSRLREAMKLEVSIVDLFRHPTISSMAELLGEERAPSDRFESVRARASKQAVALARRREQLTCRKGENG